MFHRSPATDDRAHRRRPTLHVCVVVVIGCGTVMAAGCPTSNILSDNGGPLDTMKAALLKLPGTTVGAKSILPAGVGPADALYGVLLEDNSQVFVFGSTDANGNITITDVLFSDANGTGLFQESFGTGWAALFVPGGDGIHFNVTQPNARITMLLNATSPPSEIVMVVQNNGDLVLDQAATTIELTENQNYKFAAQRLRLADPLSRLKPDISQSLSTPTCSKVSNGIIWAVQLGCDIKGLITSGIPVTVLEKSCTVAALAVDNVRAIRGNAASAGEQRVFAGLKASITALCELGKVTVGAANIVTKFNPLDAACLALSLADSGVTMKSGQSLADQICKYFSSDQILPGVMTTADRVNVSVYDAAQEDGDMVAIRHNGQQVFSGVVKNAAQVLSVSLQSGFNHFEFQALNEGTGSPNTARVTVQDVAGTGLGSTSYNLTTGQIATLDIVRQ